MRKPLSLLLIALLAVSAVRAQDWEVFDMSNSPLPSNTVSAIAEASNGDLWIGTEWGLVRYDGMDWTVLQEADGLPENMILSVAVDADDRVWAGTMTQGVAVLDQGTWTLYNSDNSGLSDNSIRHISIDHRGWAWISTSEGLNCFTGTEWRVYNDTPSSYGGRILNTGNIKSCTVRGDGLVCIGTLNGGFHYLTETSVTYLTTVNDQFFDNTANGIWIDPANGDRWVSTPAAGLLRNAGDIVGGAWFQFGTGNSTIPTNGLTSVDRDASGRFWLGTNLFGVTTTTGDGLFTTYTTTNSALPDDQVRCVRVTSSGIWAGTTLGGLAHWSLEVGQEEVAGEGPQARTWPNPFTDRFQVEVPGGVGPMDWQVHDAQGRLLGQGLLQAGTTATLGTQDWAPGPLIMTLSQGAYATRTPLVKLR